MALLKDLLNRTRLGEDIDTYEPKTMGSRFETVDYYPKTIDVLGQVTEGKDLAGDRYDTGDRDDECPPGYHFEPHLRNCVLDKVDGGDDDETKTCPDGTVVGINEECPGDVEPICPPGEHKDASGNCVPDTREGTKWCAKLGKDISIGTWSVEMCGDGGETKTCPDGTVVGIDEECPDGGECIPKWTPSTDTKGMGQSFTQSNQCNSNTRPATGTKTIDPTPGDDDDDSEKGGHREYVELEGGDEGTFYDRFPIDYDPSRFGDYQKWLRPRYDEEGKLISGTLPKQELFKELGIEVKKEFKDFFADYSWFPESLAGTEFDVGRKGMTADLFDLTRQSWQLRKGQGLLSGAPREFERLGMGQVGREFQRMDVAYRKDIYGMRKGFEEETINRLLDLMKAGAKPFDVSDFVKYEGYEGYNSDFYSWILNQRKIDSDEWNKMSQDERDAIEQEFRAYEERQNRDDDRDDDN